MCSKCPIHIKVVNKHHGHRADGISRIYIGRGSPLGNPFVIDARTSRHQAIAAYREWLIDQIEGNNPAVCKALNEVALRASSGGVDLVCFCAPSPCHGDVIKEIVTTKLNSS